MPSEHSKAARGRAEVKAAHVAAAAKRAVVREGEPQAGQGTPPPGLGDGVVAAASPSPSRTPALLSEGRANGDSAHPPRRDGPGRASASGTDRGTSGPSPLREQPETNPYQLQPLGRGYRWTREASILAVQGYAQTVGTPPGQNASRGEPVGTLPSLTAARRLFGGWAGLVEAAGFARPAWGGTRIAGEA